MQKLRFFTILPCVAVLMSGMQIVAEDAVYAPGSKIMVRLNQPLNSSTAILGQAWDGTLVNAVPIGNRVAAPAGSPADGIVSGIKRPGKLKGNGSISLILLHANGISVTSDVLTRDGEGHVKSNSKIIGSTALAGAGIGGLVGGGAGALIGAAAGAGAATSQHKDELNAESVLTFTEQ
jgi:hypothetical protein